MKEEIFVIWLKRFSPLLLILAIWLIYTWYSNYREKKFLGEADRYALITAQLWVGSTKYRNEPEKYYAFRDSTVKANSLSSNELDDYSMSLESDIEHQQMFSNRINHFVDSLIKIEENLIKKSVTDTIKTSSNTQ